MKPGELLNTVGRIIPHAMIEGAARLRDPFLKARTLVAFFYFFVSYQALSLLPNWRRENFFPEQNFSPIWPVAWVNLTGFEDGMAIVAVLFLVGSFAGALFFWHRLGRILALVGIVEFHAFSSSFGGIHHGWLYWVTIAFLFIFLPDLWGKDEYPEEEKKKFLLVYWAAQAYLLTTYSLAGLGKLYGATQQIQAGGAHAFAPDALALHVTEWLTRTGGSSILGSFFVEHLWAGWPLFLALIYLQFFSLAVAYKPSLHAPWAFGLILSHVGIYLAMNITHIESIILLMLLFYSSPFATNVTWRERFRDIPLFGWAFARFISAR